MVGARVARVEMPFYDLLVVSFQVELLVGFVRLPGQRFKGSSMAIKKVVKKVLMNWKNLTVLTRVNLSDFT